MDSGTRGDTVTSEEAISVLSATLVAVTVILVGDDTLGAENKPVAEIVPPLACHMTAVLLVEVSVAENWIWAPEATFALTGDKFIRTAGLFVEELGVAAEIPVHPVAMQVAIVRTKTARTWLRQRVDFVLVWKPGDDSKNIVRPQV